MFTRVRPAQIVRRLSMAKLNTNPIVWIDCEMTGLDIKKDRIIEIACLVTDSQLNVIAEGPSLIVNQPDSLLLNMDEWCTRTHTETGLLKACQESKITERQAEEQVLSFLRQHVKENAAPMAGNSIYMDRLFIRTQMPALDSFIHYRIIDVSSIKELCQRWNPEIVKNKPQKKLVHRALDDILESIEELRYYRNFMFVSK